MRALRLLDLRVSAFRNLDRYTLSPAPRLTVIAGENGRGKTTLLEAAYLAATSRSFRTSSLEDVVQRGKTEAVAQIRVAEGDDLPREQVVAVVGGRRVVKADGKRPPSLAAFAVRSPMVCFHAGELELSTGPASPRRTLLDRIALFFDPATGDHRQRAQTALRERQRALEARGTSARDLDAWEELAAVHGAALTRGRARAAEEIDQAAKSAFERIAAPGLTLGLSYVPGGSADVEAARRELSARRQRDLARGLATFGPHRDELALSLDGAPARVVASQGQHRAITLALKLAEVAAIGRARDLHPLLLLDDLSSELDAARTDALLRHLADSPCQMLVTTTRPELFRAPFVAAHERLDVVL
jgi:DNA replication and repair protein RecF